MKKFIKIAIFVLCIVLAFSACGSKDENKTTAPAAENSGSQAASEQNASPNAFSADIQEDPSVSHPLIKFTMTDGKTFSMKLYPEYAPITVENFVKLVSEGFYNGLTFHRVMDNFMAQGGDPKGDGTGGTDTIKGEFAINGFSENTISHKRGVVSMARKSRPLDSASCQFFICYDDCSFLDGQYAAFGYVYEGMETVDDFLKVERAYDASGEKSVPTTPIVIEKAEVIG